MKAEQTIDIISIIPLRGVSRKTQQPYEMFQAQCVVTTKGLDENGEPLLPFVGVMNLANHLKDTKPGKYDPDFKLAQGMGNTVTAVITALRPYQAIPTPKPGAGLDKAAA